MNKNEITYEKTDNIYMDVSNIINQASDLVYRSVNVLLVQRKKLEFVKNPMILEFLGIPENNSWMYHIHCIR